MHAWEGRENAYSVVLVGSPKERYCLENLDGATLEDIIKMDLK